METDVAVVGAGCAGASAALEARAQGARVLLLDRFVGGGASGMSGGIVYLGGGTKYQQQAGLSGHAGQYVQLSEARDAWHCV